MAATAAAGILLRPDVQRARVRALRARSLSAPVFFAQTLPIAALCCRNSVDLGIPLTRLVFLWFFAELRGLMCEASF